MRRFITSRGLRRYLEEHLANGREIGFVPTMGALHDGHLDLIKRSKRENNITVCSIFVNPIQFNNPDDLARYPRTIDRDLRLLREAGCDVVFLPDNREMYPHGPAPSIDLDFGTLGTVMEGKFRPGHFNGVAIVVRKFFDIVNPTRAYFGKKDYQQLAIIRFMVEKLALPVIIIPCETVRETDGLAMSSRNMRLTGEERMLAPGIYRILRQAREIATQMTVDELKDWVAGEAGNIPSFRVEYFEISDSRTLLPLETWSGSDQPVACIAVFLGDVRLIDNIEFFS
jgi:pantoate--beta-alanine ligase